MEPSTAVRAFIDAYITSIDTLRVLLVLSREPNQVWPATEICRKTALPPETVNIELQRLVTIGLAAAAADDTGFQYRPRAQEFDEMVQELMQLDSEKPVTLIRLVYSRKSGSAQAFADAFRFRRP